MGLFDRMWGWMGRRDVRGAALTQTSPLEVGPKQEPRGLRLDSVHNPLTGLGSDGDKGMAGRPNPFVIPLDDDELRLLYGYNGLGRRIVDLIPSRATRKGWTLPDVPDSEDRRLHTWERVREAMTMARLYGGAPIVMVTDDDIPPEFSGSPTQWLAQPLRLDRVQRVVALQVFDAFEAAPTVFEDDIRSPNFRGPSMWNVSTGRFTARIHASRVLWFRGARRPPSEMRGSWGRSNRMPDDSALQSIWDELRRLSEIMQGGAILAAEIRESVVKISGLGAIAASDQAGALTTRLRLMSQSKSLTGITLLDDGDSYENRSNPPTGFNELSNSAKAMLAAVSGIPEVILFGATPSGLNTDGESSWQGFRQLVSDYQEQNRENLEQLYRVVLGARNGPTQGVIPEEIGLTFHALDEPSAQDTASLRKAIADTDTIYISAGVYTAADVARARFSEEGYSTEMPAVAIPTAPPSLPTDVPGTLPAAALPGEPPAAAVDAYPERRDATGDGVFVLLPAPTPPMTLRVAVERATGQRLSVPDLASHVTVLYVGAGIRPRFELSEVLAVVADEAADVEGYPLGMGSVKAFPPGPKGVPIVVEFGDAWPVQMLHERLLRRLAHRVTQRQHRRYRPHLTLGYLPEPLSPETAAALTEIDASAVRVALTELHVVADGEVVGRYVVGAEPV